MKSALILVFSLILSVHADAQTTEPQINDWQSGWSQLLKDVVAKGEPFSNQVFAAYHFQYGTSFDPRLDRQVAYFTLIGKLDGTGRFSANEASTVSETWTQLGPHWLIEQCVRVSDLSGTLVKIIAKDFVLDPSRKVLSTDYKKVGAVSDPVEINAWKKTIQFWMNHGQGLPVSNPEVVLNSKCSLE